MRVKHGVLLSDWSDSSPPQDYREVIVENYRLGNIISQKYTLYSHDIQIISSIYFNKFVQCIIATYITKQYQLKNISF